MMPILECDDLTKTFTMRRRGRKVAVSAVRGVSLRLDRGTTLGIVGESGSGKSTTARLILRLIEADSGSVRVGGTDVFAADSRALRALQRRMPMVFQDPNSSLDPTWLIGDIVTEGAALEHDLSSAGRHERAVELLDSVGLPASFADRYPYELSGGQRQRVAIARALGCEPQVMVCDEAVAALDVSTRASVISLLQRLQSETGVGYLFISHDLTLVEAISDAIAVMYLGQVVEFGPTDRVYETPAHPYTRALIDAVPVPDPAVQRSKPHVAVRGEVPSAMNVPDGCTFHSRCPFATDVCRAVVPELREVRPGQRAACHHSDDLLARLASSTPIQGDTP